MTTPTAPPRITIRAILNQLMAHLNLEKGLLYSLWGLLVRPGQLIRDYFFEDRKKLVKPLTFVFLFVGISTYLLALIMDSGVLGEVETEIQLELRKYFEVDRANHIGTQVNTIIIKYRNALQLSGIPVLAFFSFLVFRKEKWNYAEHLILGCYVIGYIAWITVFASALFLAIGNIYLLLTSGVISLAYQTYFYWAVFGKGWKTLLKVMILNVLYYVFFGLLMVGAVTMLVQIFLQ